MSRISRDQADVRFCSEHSLHNSDLLLLFNIKMTDKFDETTQVLRTLLPEAYSLIILQKELAEFLETQQAQVRTQAYRDCSFINC